MRNINARCASAGGAFAIVVLATIIPEAASAQPTIAFGASMFSADDGQKVAVDTGTLLVPSNRASANANKRLVSLPIVRFAGTSTNARGKSSGAAAARASAPIIYLSGGSGSGIAAARGARVGMFLALRELGDVITFDLRGAGHSTPRVDCGTAGIPDLDKPMSYQGVAEVLTRQAATCADSLRRAGVDLAGHNVREVVEDIESLRKALGAQYIRLIGISTGSQLVLEYVRRHGDHVAQVVAAGVQAPDQNAHLPLGQEQVVRSLDSLLKNGAGPNAPALLALLRPVLDSTSAQPRVATIDNGRGGKIPVAVGPFDVQLLVSATLGDRKQMAMLPMLLGAAAKGSYVPLATMKAAAAKQGINSAYEALMDCQTGTVRARRDQVVAESRTALLGMATLDFPEHCQGWGVTPLDESYRAPVRSNVPVLLVSGTLDGRTPVANAEAAARTLSNAIQLVIHGASHGDDLFLGSRDIVPTMLRFFRGEKLPQRIDLSVQ